MECDLFQSNHFLSSFRMIFACLHLEYSSFNFSVCCHVRLRNSISTSSNNDVISYSVSFLWKISLETFNPNGSLDHLYRPNGVIIVVNKLDWSFSFTCQYVSLMSNLLNSLAFWRLGSMSSRVGNLNFLGKFRCSASYEVYRAYFNLTLPWLIVFR